MAKVKAKVATQDEAAKLGIVVFVDVKDDKAFAISDMDQYAETLQGERRDSPRYLNHDGSDYKTMYRFWHWEDAKEFADTLNKQLLYGLRK